MIEKQDKTVMFSPWIKYYESVYQLMHVCQSCILRGDFELALKNLILWHDSLDLENQMNCKDIESDYQLKLKKAEKELKLTKRMTESYYSNNNRIDRIEWLLLDIHRLLQKGMYRKGMKYSEKDTPITEFDPEEFIKGSDL